MYLNIENSLLDEISLEGLEGITFESLWIRLKDRGYCLNVDEFQVQSYLYANIIIERAKKGDVQFFCLPKERKTIKLYNRYDNVNPETGSCVEGDDIPVDVYGMVTPVSDGSIRGSCHDYETRKNLTRQIIGNLKP